MHTTETDGSASIAEMAEAARELGHDSIAITDHSQAVTVANGMTPDRFQDHIDAIRQANRNIEGIELLAGIEVDILKDGSLDMDHALLEEADWVVGSIHSHFNLEPDAMTDRLLRAIETGLLDALGHPTGRILGGRDGYRFDFDAVLEAALEHDVAMEINGSAGRLDLNAEMARTARARQVKLVLGSDAHSTRGLEDLRYAVQQARRAWLEADDLLNTWSPDALRDW
jgi:DNA polymerase (family 10)